MNWRKRLAGALGFEPRQTDPESVVLPLDDAPKLELVGQQIQSLLSNRPPADRQTSARSSPSNALSSGPHYTPAAQPPSADGVVEYRTRLTVPPGPVSIADQLSPFPHVNCDLFWVLHWELCKAWYGRGR